MQQSYLKKRVHPLFMVPFFFLIFAVESGAEIPRLRRLEVVSAATVSERQVKAWLGLSEGVRIDPSSLSQRCQTLLLKLREEGYYFARVDSLKAIFTPDSAEVIVTVYLHEGKVVKLHRYTIEGIDAENEDILGSMRLREGSPFYADLLERDIETILRSYEERGFPYCRVVLQNLGLSPENAGVTDSLVVHLDVQPGERITIEEIEIIGNRQTKRKTIVRELPVQVGDVYQQKDVDQIPRRLMNLGFFKWVNPPRLELLQQGAGRMLIELAEGSHNRFDGIVGYNPAVDSREGFFTGILDFKFGNLFGTARQLAARWEKRSRETQSLRFHYTEPWVAGLPLEAGFGFQQLIQDTSYIEREVGIDLRYRLNESLRLIGGLARSEISPDSVGAVRFGILPSSSINLSLGISFGNIDRPLNPTSGVLYATSLKWSEKNISRALADTIALPQTGSISQRRLTVDFESYFPLFRWQVLALGLHGREITTDEAVVTVPDQYRFGGTKTLRGYREEQFSGERVAWVNFEYRYLLGPLSRLFAFLDAGYFFRRELIGDQEISDNQSLKFGYGFGIRLSTRLGVVGVDYGLGEGDSFSNGKVHIGLMNEF